MEPSNNDTSVAADRDAAATVPLTPQANASGTARVLFVMSSSSSEDDGTTTDSSHSGTELEGTTATFDTNPDVMFKGPQESRHGCDEKEEYEDPIGKEIAKQQQEECRESTLGLKMGGDDQDNDVSDQGIQTNDAQGVAGNEEKAKQRKPTKISDIGKIYNISCIKQPQATATSQSGPGAYSVHTATTAGNSSAQERERTTPAAVQDERPPLKFWRDESTASGASASARASPSRSSRLIEATLVTNTANHLVFPPTTGRPRRLSSSHAQRHSFSQRPADIESDPDGEASSADNIAEATALSSSGVVLVCLKSRTGYLLVFGAVLLVVGLVVGLVLGLGGDGEEDHHNVSNSVNMPPVANNTSAAPTLPLEPSASPSLTPTQAPTRLFGADLLPEVLQESLLDPKSPQSMALEWILEDPQLNDLPLARKLQRYAMVVFYYVVSGDGWTDSTSWLEYNTSECEWFSAIQEGMRPCNPALELIHLVVPSNGLQGSLPPELALLSNIQTLDLSGNPSLTGSIPSALWQGDLANNMRLVDLGHTGLTGSLPGDGLGSWSRLTSLNLEGASYITGSLPTQLGLLSSLQDLTLALTKMSGAFPSEMGRLSKLTSLQMRSCHMTGIYPTELGELSSLEYLDLGENTMSGTIPTQLGLLTSLSLIAMDNSFLSGSIPSEVGTIKTMKTFNVFANRLSGSIPTELMRVSGLEYLFLNQNRLRGPIPTEIGHLSSLLWLLAWDNQITGTLPSELQANAALSLLSLATNPLSGTIPTELFTVTTLEWLFLGWSYISSTIPTEVGQLSNLIGLYLNTANLSGAIPSETGLLSHLTDLWIDSHVAGLTGSIPTEVGSIKFLAHFKANNNRLNGSLPSEICSPSLETLDLSHNEFSGTLPADFGNMKQLSVLDVQDNFLTGLIPADELSSLSFLRELRLHNNSFSGQLPDELCEVDALVLDCSEFLCGCECACPTG